MTEMVERLRSIPPHTAAVERLYSRLGFMQGSRRGNLSTKMLTDMAMVNTCLVAADPQFGKPPRDDSARIATHASGDGQGRATAGSWGDGSDDDRDDDDSVLGCEDGPADADDDAAATASNSNNESLLCAENPGVAPTAPEGPTSKKQRALRGVESGFLLARLACDLTSPSLLAGIHGCSVAQEAPTREAPQTSTGGYNTDGAERVQQMIDGLLFSDD
jgi:hypothetical protein